MTKPLSQLNDVEITWIRERAQRELAEEEDRIKAAQDAQTKAAIEAQLPRRA